MKASHLSCALVALLPLLAWAGSRTAYAAPLPDLKVTDLSTAAQTVGTIHAARAQPWRAMRLMLSWRHPSRRRSSAWGRAGSVLPALRYESRRIRAARGCRD